MNFYLMRGYIVMEHIEALFLVAQNNIILVFLIAILATFLESFVPALPLIGIVIMNSALLGFWGGIISSAIGSCLGTIGLFLLASKFKNLKYFDKLKNEKTDKITNWVRKQNYIVLYLCYASAFIPSCLISVSSGFSGKSLKSFLPGMILGKITMFGVASYIGYDITGLINQPIRIAIVLIMVVVSFLIGKKISSTMANNKTVNI